MSVSVPLRGDFGAAQLRGLARKTKDGPQARRLLALAAIYDGATRTEAAKIGGVGLQIIRDWVLRFNARGPDGLLDGKSPGHPGARGSFFKILDRTLDLGMVAWPGRELAIAHGPQLPAQGLLGDGDAEFLVDPLRQIDQPPTHHAVGGWDWAALDHPRNSLALNIIELRWLHVDAACRSSQHHHHRPAAEMPRAQPGGKRLAVHARQLEIAREKAIGVEDIEIWFQMLWRRAEPILFGSPNQSDGAAVMQPNDTNSPTILLAIELSASTWLVAARVPGSEKPHLHRIDGGDTVALLTLISSLQARVACKLDATISVVCCFEAGRDGFWLQRLLTAQGVDTHVLEPTSILINRRARRAKTDRLDAVGMLRARLYRLVLSVFDSAAPRLMS